MTPTVPRYAIHFYDFEWIGPAESRREINSMILIDEIAKRLKVESEQIIEAFQLWACNGYPQEYFMGICKGEKVKGGSYNIGILVWNYQGQNSGVMEGPNMMGVISKVREWGKGYQTIDGTKRESFYLGPLA